ncbi:hypothetical protein TIFTF001_037572, partial [Ficus carica]
MATVCLTMMMVGRRRERIGKVVERERGRGERSGGD